ncbi:nicotinamide/nicotinic acid mononucleotide adenylyltransferase 3 isoform X2 [Adelges cooleyi]|uniref:nicotinamide/nicotinic acid mononucleotide adenylyltransferase 3 isoform X2 n=1 Tax=Adelges cooleyi TaxID=133065 RepID=UPI0021804E3A|nr:nicotinamide/nicotinic acid mononucleotide adenylyltransferase 3 isoform X2 [Adelges cooleyi]
MYLENKNIVLLATGSFNPPTNMHFRMFEIARDHLNRLGYTVCGGLVSPVHDSYKKKDLVASTHRCAMLELALTTLPWVKMSNWEVRQNKWTCTRQVLQYHQNYLNSVINSRLNGTNNEKFLLPVQFLKDIITNKSKTNRAINVRLLCGADLLESFAVPGLWDDDDIETIVRDYGLVVISRSGSNPNKFIYESDILTKYMANIIIVTEWISNEISSTKIRRALCRNDSVKFLLNESVESYIKDQGLYGTDNNTKTLQTPSIMDQTVVINEPDHTKIIHSKRKENNCKKSKVSNEDESKLNICRVAIQVSKNGLVEVISDRETMV